MGVTALAVIPLGLLLRSLPLGLVADLAGGVLYAALIYLLVACLAPRWRPATVALWAMSWCFAVELLQLSGLPADLARIFPPSRLVFGTGFSALDLVAYVPGVLFPWLIDRRRSGILSGATAQCPD